MHIRTIFKLITILILLSVIIISGLMMEMKLEGYRQEKEIKTKISTEVRAGREVNFDKLLEENPDVKAWIYLPGSNIDYPVVQAEDNDYYLHRGLDRECVISVLCRRSLNESTCY